MHSLTAQNPTPLTISNVQKLVNLNALTDYTIPHKTKLQEDDALGSIKAKDVAN